MSPFVRPLRRITGLMAAFLRYIELRTRIPSSYAQVGLDELIESLSRAPRRRAAVVLADLLTVVRAAERLAPHLTSSPNTCLFRALARFALLAEHAHQPTFFLGLPPSGALPAHAWVEVAGAPFLEPGTPTFVRVFHHEAA